MHTSLWLAVLIAAIGSLNAQDIKPSLRADIKPALPPHFNPDLVANLPCFNRPIVPETWCVDLSNGVAEKPPSWARWLSYSNKAGCCNDQGVLALTPPSWAKSLRIEESASGSSGWTLNLGDSPTNNGYGGDASTTTNDAEVQILNGYFSAWKNDVCGSGWMSGSSGSVGSTRTSSITVEQWGVKVDSTPSGFSYNKCTRCLFNWSRMYLGLNRVVSSTSRTGKGLCKVCIRFSPYATIKPCFPIFSAATNITLAAAVDP